MRYFLAKRHEGPALVVAHRIDAIWKWLKEEGDVSAAAEPAMEIPRWDDPELRCFPAGQNQPAGPGLVALAESILERAPSAPGTREGQRRAIVSLLGIPDPLPVTEAESLYGIHAGDWETSVMLALSPERVRPGRRDRAFPAFEGHTLNLEFTGANVAWLTADFMESGTWGDATVATAERGRSRVSAVVPQLVRILTEISSFEMQRDDSK